MRIRQVTEEDRELTRPLWEEFEAEIPEPAGFEPETFDEDWLDVARDIAGGAVYLAEDDNGVVGIARASKPERGRSHINVVYVRPRARRHGVTTALLREVVSEVKAKGAHTISLDVLLANEAAHTVWRRLGFEEFAVQMATPLEQLERRLNQRETGETRATTHVQTDDNVSVARTLAQFVPHLDAPDVRSTANGWIRIEDSVTGQDRDVQARLARELSERLGAVVVALALEQGAVVRMRLYERGRMVDEYLSVPTYYGELPKGDELALAANPTLVSRLTGADREEVRSVARTALSPAQLEPAPELYERLAKTIGVVP
jgi:GNAT superfamily N-acetyltransferase